jgi:AcrR family transcriptional regulator
MNGRSSTETKPASLRTRLREATAAAILDAAEDIFAEQGLAGAHMNDIATRAGVAVGTMYNHFKDRDAMLAALMRERRMGMYAVMDDFLEQPTSGNFRDDLMALMRLLGAYLEEHKRFHHIMHQCDLPGVLAPYPETATAIPEMKQQMHLRLHKLMKRGLEQKALRPELAKYYPSLLMGILRSAKQRQAELADEEDHMPIEEIVRFFMEGAGV